MWRSSCSISSSCKNLQIMQALRKLSQNTLKFRPVLYNTSCYFCTQTSALKPSTCAHYDQLINEAGWARDFIAVQELLKKRYQEGLFNTSRTFKFVASDLSILDDLLDSLAGLSDGFMRKSSHDFLIMQLSKMDCVQKALHVAKVMMRNRYGPNACTFHPILNRLAKNKEMDEAWKVIQVMKEHWIEPGLTGYNYLLTAYCFDGNLESAALVLEKIEEDELEADTRTYDALVLGACRAGKISGALMILRRMVSSGVTPLYSTHTHVISAMVRNGFCAQAVKFVMIFAGKDGELDRETFGLLASRLVRLNKIDEAKFIMKEMNRREIEIEAKLKDLCYFYVGDE